MSFRYDIDTSQATGFFKDLSRMSGASWEAVMLYEVGKILEECVKLTTRENKEKIKRSIDFKNRTLRFGGKGSGPAIIYITKTGVIWFADEPGAGNEGIAKGRTAGGKSFHPMSEFFRYGDPRFAKYSGFLQELGAQQISVNEVLGRAGKSWVDCGRAIGIDVAAPAYVKNAPGFKGKTYINGTGTKGMTTAGVFIKIRNEAPILLGTFPGHQILQRAVNGRAEYFRTNLRKGVFEDVAERARRYKGIFVS